MQSHGQAGVRKDIRRSSGPTCVPKQDLLVSVLDQFAECWSVVGK